MEAKIRILGLEDYDRLMALWQRAGLTPLRPKGRDSREAIARQLATGVQTILGLEMDGRLIGAVIATHDSRKGWINRLAVDPEFRRRGYGLRLIRAAEDVLKSQGIEVIAALVESDNLASLALFRKAGYVVRRCVNPFQVTCLSFRGRRPKNLVPDLCAYFPPLPLAGERGE